MKKILNSMSRCLFRPSQKIYISRAGMSPLVTILIIGAAVLIIAINSAVIGQGSLDMSLAEVKGRTALDLANSCAYEILQKIKLNFDYAVSSTTLPIGDNLCIISVAASSLDRQINILSQVEEYYRELTIGLTIQNTATSSNKFLIYEWREY